MPREGQTAHRHLFSLKEVAWPRNSLESPSDEFQRFSAVSQSSDGRNICKKQVDLFEPEENSCSLWMSENIRGSRQNLKAEETQER